MGNYDFSENLDYNQTSDVSIWGEGDKDTLEIVKKLISGKKIYGKWLNFAAGDGRYNNLLLREASQVVATDIDAGALEKIQRIAPKELSTKLLIQTQDITKPFPFENNSFDGIFNTGTLHLFPQTILDQIIKESYRILKPGGLFIFDFATDVKRIKDNGTHIGKSSIEYTQKEARTLLDKLLNMHGYRSQFILCKVPTERVTVGDESYDFSCNYWLIIAKKNK